MSYHQDTSRVSWRINTNAMFRLNRALAAQNDLEQSTQIFEPVLDTGFSLSASVCIRRRLYALLFISWFTILYDFVTPSAAVFSRLPGTTLKLRSDTFSACSCDACVSRQQIYLVKIHHHHHHHHRNHILRRPTGPVSGR